MREMFMEERRKKWKRGEGKMIIQRSKKLGFSSPKNWGNGQENG